MYNQLRMCAYDNMLLDNYLYTLCGISQLAPFVILPHVPLYYMPVAKRDFDVRHVRNHTSACSSWHATTLYYLIGGTRRYLHITIGN